METPIDLQAKMALIRKYESQPIAALEQMIRDAAGDSPVERRWIVEDMSVLAVLGERTHRNTCDQQ